MSNISIFNGLLEIYNIVDTLDDQAAQFDTITAWIRSLSGILQVNICNLSEPDKNAVEQSTNGKTNYIRNLLSRKPDIIYSNDNELNNFLNEFVQFLFINISDRFT